MNEVKNKKIFQQMWIMMEKFSVKCATSSDVYLRGNVRHKAYSHTIGSSFALMWRITLIPVIELAWQSGSTMAVMGLAVAGIEGIYAE